MTNQTIKEYFVKIQNEFITEGSRLHLNDKELYLYSLLFMNKRLDDTLLTTLSLLHDFMHIKFSQQKDRNIKSMKETLCALVDKGIIEVVSPDGEIATSSKLKASDSIRVLFMQFVHKGHVQIPYSKLEACKTLQDFYIFSAVKRWENSKEGVFKCDYDRFAAILKVARSTAQRNIDKAVDDGLIFRNTGDYLDNENGEQKLQDKNEYKCVPFEYKDKSLMTKKNEASEKYSDEGVYDELEDDFYYDDGELERSYNNWNTFKDEYGEQFSPSSEDHLLAIEVEENLKHRKPTKMEYKYMDKVKWRTAQMKKTNKGNEMWEKSYHEGLQDYENKLHGKDNSIVVPKIQPVSYFPDISKSENPENLF